VAIGSVAFSYAWFLVLSEGTFTRGLAASVLASGVAAVIGAWMVRRLHRTREHLTVLRYVAICTDISAITIAMAGADEGGVPFVGFYLWVTVGNGFRFGPRFLLASYWLSLVGYGTLLLFVPFWVEHRAFSLGVLVMLGVVPLYVLVLLTRLTAQKDEAEQLSNAKSRFVANVSHELRTPLTGVFAVYDLLRSRKMTSDDRELVGMLGNAITTLKSSVDAVLMMSKLEAGAESTDRRPFNLWFFLQQLTAIVRPQSVAKGLAWRLDVEGDVPSVVVGDQEHLGHALGNLLNNAFKFTSRGSVTLRVSRVSHEHVRFEVIDTGIGIPLEHQERLFERFVQVDTSATRRHGGTGLGTSIARDLIELMDGTIGVTSAPGQGSTFWIELPLKEARGGLVTQDWAISRQVLLVGLVDSRLAVMSRSLKTFGLEPIVVRADAGNVPVLDPARFFAVILVMDAADAATFCESTLRERSSVACPWLVAAPSYSDIQRSTLLRAGTAGLLAWPCPEESLAAVLGALRNRLESPTPLPVSATTAGVVRPLHVLLADDNKSNQLLLSRILQDRGHSVVTAETGGAAFDVMSAGGIDLALLDLNMPDMSGPDVVKLFRAGSVGGAHLPIMILSADATLAAKRESMDAGADEFLTKPVVAATLLTAIERLVAGADARRVEPKLPAETTDASANSCAPLVDPDRIQALSRIARGDVKFLDQYTNAAFSEVEQAIADLRIASAASNIRKARDALHIVEGTGASIGAVALVATCKAVRNYFTVPGDPECAGALAELSTTYALTKSTIIATLRHSADKVIGGRGARK
jgi:two-component system sensor histidine kinase RpfC